jgi:hypothetical protein
MTDERMLRFPWIPDGCTSLRVEFLGGNQTMEVLYFHAKDLELAPPKDWTPKCFGEYHTAFSDCRDCVWQKECDEYDARLVKEEVTHTNKDGTIGNTITNYHKKTKPNPLNTL